MIPASGGLAHRDKGKYVARWLGSVHNVGSAMTWWVLPASCRLHARIDVWELTAEELRSDKYQTLIRELDASIAAKIEDK